MVSDREKELEFQRHILWHIKQSRMKAAMRGLHDTKWYMGSVCKILYRAFLLTLIGYLQCLLEELRLLASFRLGLKLKRGHIVSCFPEHAVPFCFSFRCPNCVERRAEHVRPKTAGLLPFLGG